MNTRKNSLRPNIAIATMTLDSKGDAEVATSIAATSKDITVSGSEIKHPAAGDANVALGDGNTGADTSVFGWTGMQF